MTVERLYDLARREAYFAKLRMERDDLIQELVIAAWLGMSKFDESLGSSEDAYARAVMRNWIANKRRSSTRMKRDVRKTVEFPTDLDGNLEEVPFSDLSQEMTILRNDVDSYCEAHPKMSHEMETVLRNAVNLIADEKTAEELGWTKRQVTQRKSVMFKRFRDWIKKGGIEHDC